MLALKGMQLPSIKDSVTMAFRGPLSKSGNFIGQEAGWKWVLQILGGMWAFDVVKTHPSHLFVP